MKVKGLKIMMIFSIFIFLFTGCGLYGPEETMEIDPPPVDLSLEDNSDISLEVTDLNTEQAPSDTGKGMATEEAQTVKLTIYFFDENENVVPLTMEIPKVEGIGQEVLKYMTAGGPGETMLPIGFKTILPEGTNFTMNIKPEEKLAIVDFSKEFLSYKADSPEVEKKILEAITWSLTEFPTVEKVEIRVNGYTLEVMPVWNTPIIGPISRIDGINLELASNIQIGQTTFVTLYFNKTTEKNDYLVPITRMIPKTDNIAKATLEQLIIGPKSGTGLSSPILPTTKVLSVEVSNQLLVADFDEDILGFNQELSQDVIDMIVWSLAENTEIPAIKLKVKGESTLLPEDLAKPINKPVFINSAIF